MPIDRRDFLRLGAASALALAPTATKAASTMRAERCLVINLLGGPSQLETWDPKPNAPSHVRGPFRAIATSVPGTRISEHFPRLAERTHRFAIVRSVHHDAAPVHETGLQLLQTGRLAGIDGDAPPWFTRAAQDTKSPPMILPGPIESTGVSPFHGQTCNIPRDLPSPGMSYAIPWEQTRYGYHNFGNLLGQAFNQLIHGQRFITVNLFTALADQVTWDCHAADFCHASTLADYRETLCPAFDQAFAALLDDLAETGLLDSTLVIAQGEMGRTPHLNSRGGRDHWPAAWSILLAGGGIRGGAVLGSTDALATEPRDRPVHAAEIFATILHAQGIDLRSMTSHRSLDELF